MSITTLAPARTRSAAARATGVALAAAVLGNLVVWGAARLLGADFHVVRPDGAAFTVGAGPVVVFTVGSIVVGGLALVVASRLSTRAWSALAWLGLAIGILTVPMPFTVTADLDTQLALVVMHLLTGLAWFVALRRGVTRPE
ncbi:hypothetical protein DDE18_22050 [Nocardioides gansuensis]|uniref:Uncharacterized protein n=1 Tax=Nocardioides gansuensis TaxID=2138300 RepID=A0A2T8F4P4_9ACTN|nr:DUF6069 family protein [Nocardioides gansuensis]PVG80685.1 hypothetical protein DDE18_22050 [Nocardioides gansuensis]